MFNLNQIILNTILKLVSFIVFEISMLFKKIINTNLNETNSFYGPATRWIVLFCFHIRCLQPSLSSLLAHRDPSMGSTRVCKKAFLYIWMFVKLNKFNKRFFFLLGANKLKIINFDVSTQCYLSLFLLIEDEKFW